MDTATVCVKEALKTGSFSDSLKCANVRTIYKKKDPFDKKNYRPVSRLTVYDRVIYEQASNYFQHFFKEILCGLEKHMIRNMFFLNC